MEAGYLIQFAAMNLGAFLGVIVFGTIYDLQVVHPSILFALTPLLFIASAYFLQKVKIKQPPQKLVAMRRPWFTTILVVLIICIFTSTLIEFETSIPSVLESLLGEYLSRTFPLLISGLLFPLIIALYWTKKPSSIRVKLYQWGMSITMLTLGTSLFFLHGDSTNEFILVLISLVFSVVMILGEPLLNAWIGQNVSSKYLSSVFGVIQIPTSMITPFAGMISLGYVFFDLTGVSIFIYTITPLSLIGLSYGVRFLLKDKA